MGSLPELEYVNPETYPGIVRRQFKRGPSPQASELNSSKRRGIDTAIGLDEAGINDDRDMRRHHPHPALPHQGPIKGEGNRPSGDPFKAKLLSEMAPRSNRHVPHRLSSATTSSVVFTSAKTRAMVFRSA